MREGVRGDEKHPRRRSTWRSRACSMARRVPERAPSGAPQAFSAAKASSASPLAMRITPAVRATRSPPGALSRQARSRRARRSSCSCRTRFLRHTNRRASAGTSGRRVGANGLRRRHAFGTNLTLAYRGPTRRKQNHNGCREARVQRMRGVRDPARKHRPDRLADRDDHGEHRDCGSP